MENLRRMALLTMTIMAAVDAGAQFTYDNLAEVEAAHLGVERSARIYYSHYQSPASDNNQTRWVQIDLGRERTFDMVKLLPDNLEGSFLSHGFPAHFRIEVSNDSTFDAPAMYADYCVKLDDYNNRENETFTVRKQATGRYVRLTATKLRDSKLALQKMMVVRHGRDIAVGCHVTESNPAAGNNPQALTRPERPMGEYVVTDNPSNVILPEEWHPVPDVVATPITGITLGGGLFRKVMERNVRYLMETFTLDDLVYNFRQKAGMPMPPRSERHSYFWTHQLPGSTAGRFLMGAGGTLRWMEDHALRARMDSVVDIIDQCKEPDGYLMAYPKRAIFDFENGAYVRSWVTHGLIEAGYAGNAKAFGLLRDFYDWFESSPFLPEMLRRPGQGVQGAIPLTRTYFSPVGKTEDICTMQRYFQQNYWMDWLIQRNADAIWKYPYDRPHNYLVTAIEPYLDMYRATGYDRYLEAARGFWELFHDNWEHIGGSLAINEGYFPYPPKSLYLKANTGELCGNAFWVKLNQRFHNLYPYEERYMAEIEKSLYNVIIPNQVSDRGIAYFARMHGRKQGYEPGAEIATNTCCEGQGTRIYGSLPEYIYSLMPNGVQVNLFEASSIIHTVGGQRLQVTMHTGFPYSNDVLIDVSCDGSVEACIEIRVPTWAAKPMAVSHNGKRMQVGSPGTYIKLNRRWEDGDRIEFTLPATFRTTQYSGMQEGFATRHYALEYGPVLMAAVCTGEAAEPTIPCKPGEIASMMVPVSGKPLHFTIKGCNDIELMPYYEVEGQSFSNFPEYKEP